jgi:ADP-ribose pyrophosphatase YjhB (NUDIX family)
MIDKHRLARLFRRFPVGGLWFTTIYRRTQPRLTAGVTGVLLDDQCRVLLVEHVFHARLPWGLPGGWLDRNEEPARAVKREFLEETGLHVEVVRPLAVVKGRMWKSHLDITYLVRAESPLPPVKLSYELSDFAWFALDDLPPLNRFTREVLALVADLVEAELSI